MQVSFWFYNKFRENAIAPLKLKKVWGSEFRVQGFTCPSSLFKVERGADGHTGGGVGTQVVVEGRRGWRWMRTGEVLV
jgi:hypothetical protein